MVFEIDDSEAHIAAVVATLAALPCSRTSLLHLELACRDRHVMWVRMTNPSGRTAVKIHEIPVNTLAGDPATLGDHAGKALLLVNVASKCGLTPQYTGLEQLHEELAGRGFSVLGFPCNQFGGQEPGTAEEIVEFCSTTYGVTFPLYEKIEVNGDGRHPIYDALTAVPDADGEAGDIQWNFEKFLVAPTGEIVGRFRPRHHAGRPGAARRDRGRAPGVAPRQRSTMAGRRGSSSRTTTSANALGSTSWAYRS